jgi:uncharacterized protein (UPF0548 family)
MVGVAVAAGKVSALAVHRDGGGGRGATAKASAGWRILRRDGGCGVGDATANAASQQQTWRRPNGGSATSEAVARR